ncbi:ATP-dependent DNA helicase [Kineosporia sp. A_224]|uniref:ATP-dependent helicase n=1 Tax=Kineosporia sp. A_224 TaxID=1962180 RepID=UPI0018E97D1A|nr:ATP-dependent DNA helicase [Kineosporia sp. A_224]
MGSGTATAGQQRGRRADGPRIRLVRPAPAAPAVPAEALDAAQAAVVAHGRGAGPLVVLGGPGTGKTTALVEAVVARVERDGVPPDAVLVLAPSRTAASALRDRISGRLARTVKEPLARTPHAYAFGLLRRARVLDGDVPPRLISGPEQDQILADLLAGHVDGVVEGPAWPPGVGEEIRALRGFRDELRDLLMRAVERGLGPDDLEHLGRAHDRPDWVAAAAVLGEYLDVTALATPGAYDPAGIVDAATALLETDPDLLAQEQERRLVVAVDDAHEATAATLRLLDVLAGEGRDLLLTGDPDAATQTFRGARPALLAAAPQRYPRLDGGPAPTVVLRTVHRHGTALRAVARRVAERIGSTGAVAHRGAQPVAPADGGPPTGSAQVALLSSGSLEAAYVAQHLRRHHLEGGVPWSAMAVVVRSARATQPLRRAMAAAGVPVAVPPAEVPVRDEPAVRPLRLAMRCALSDAPPAPEDVAELLTGPVGGADAVALRRLRQALRAVEIAAGGGRGSDDLLVEAVLSPGSLVLVEPRVAAPAFRVAAAVTAGRTAAAVPGATAETVLWALWETAGLAAPWRRTALRGGQAGARADRDLDAVVALFEAAERYVDRLPHAGPAGFLAYLEGQDLPSDTLAERAPDGEAVALVTAAGAAGREWDVVAVPGVQEGVWPDLRLRSSLLGAQAIADLLDGRSGAGGGTVAAQRRAVLDDELRTFHVGVSRARAHLLVTAVRSEDELPSGFVDLVDPLPDDVEVRPVTDVPRSMTLPALVAELRGVATDDTAHPARRDEAARRLAELADAGVPGAHPDDWFGLPDLTDDRPLRGPGDLVAVSPSRIEQFDRCALRWLLESSGGTTGSSVSQALGTLVHEVAQQVPDLDRAALAERLAATIGRLGLGDGWVDERQRQRAHDMVTKLSDYASQARKAGRELVAVERSVEVQVGRAVVRGQVDRVERDADGRLVVVDLKTGKSAPASAELARHAQLGVYQVAVEEGGFDDVAPGRESGGALLVQLGTTRKSAGVQEQPPLASDDDPQWARRLVTEAADGMAGDAFPASGNPMCRMCAVRRSCPLQPEGRQVGA